MAQEHTSLATACARALIASARNERAATRQQLRAAARRFVRRHGHDAAYLRWVLRSVAASSALALSLLGLAAEPAFAQQTLFTPLTANPLIAHDVGLFSAPALGDLDGDGDLELVAGTRLGGFAWLENTGSATSAAYVARTGAANPLNGQDVGLFSAPALCDLDGDGDLDLVAGKDLGGFFYFENTGDENSPAFVARTGAANPLDGQGTEGASAPALGDLDADGDLDLVAGEYGGTFAYFENTGSATTPAFAPRTGATNPLDGQGLGYYASPALGDLDDDGDLDLVAGRLYGDFASFQNTGSAASPAFAVLANAADPLDGLAIDSFTTPALGDLDGDGDLDLVTGEPAGAFFSFENQQGRMLTRIGSANPLGVLTSSLENADSFGDLDGDGDLDMVVGHIDGVFPYFENTGSATRPALIRRTGASNPLLGQDVGSSSTPALADLDDDGDLDVVAGNSAGTFNYFENTGTASSAAFIARTGAANPLTGHDVGTSSTPTLADLDGDGDFDLFSGETSGTFFYFENTGSAATPAFIARTGAANPLIGADVGQSSKPALGDLDGDGDLDVVAGHYFSRFAYFENTGSAASPVFVARTGTANPLDQLRFSGISSKPVLADLDGDGDLDVCGNHDFIENAIVEPTSGVLAVPEPGPGWMLGAGTALLGLLGRWRRRRER